MKTKEEQLKEVIENHASSFASNRYDKHDDFCNKYHPCKEGFIKGALSNSSKAYWQNGMYTEEEVRELCEKALFLGINYEDDFPSDHPTFVSIKFEMWFESIKKK